jgi:predicted O-methyltransferase YrrM
MTEAAAEYQFTKDWFNWAPAVWEQLKPLLPERKMFLEIGSFEGRSTVWTVENMMEDGSELVAIDTWEGGEEHASENMRSVEDRFDHNIRLVQEKYGFDHDADRYNRHVWKERGTSTKILATLLAERRLDDEYDFIYIDGSHRAPHVLTDACMAWPLLKPKGIMVFDDYLWGDPRDVLHRPKVAIDAFINIFAEEVEVVHVGYQLAVRKKESV